MKGFFKQKIRQCQALLEHGFGESEFGYQRYLSALFSLVGSLIAVATGINAWLLGLTVLSISLCIAGGLLFLCSWILIQPAYAKFHGVMKYVSLMALFLLGAYLIASGGVNNSGPLWVFVFPAVFFAFCGFKIGMILNLLFVVLMVLMLFAWGHLLQTFYPQAFKSRLIFAYLTTAALSGFYEMARHSSYMKMKGLMEKFEHESRLDELTLLPNRRGMGNTLREEYRRILKSQSVSSIAVFDIDYFKGVNDSFGHDVGDEVLRHVSQVLRDGIEPQDTLSRWGGEEFLLLMPETNEEEAINRLEDLRKRMQSMPYVTSDFCIQITFSVGVCDMAQDRSLTEIIYFADMCLYRAKHQGRNCVVGYSSVTL
ncbi:GGDEF domain-containing protein [Marinomonas sp. THO17]|uniref:GGDEF domain-containing protein n=1 Tax=Marinomonas sp. THO17 TaxID=3149048 RepID=UPI00336C272D